MQITTTKEVISPVLSRVIGAADSRSSILSTVLLTAKTGFLSLLCSDNGMLAKSKASVETRNEGAIAVDAQRLISLFRTLPDKQPVELSNDGKGRLNVRAGRHRFHIPAFAASEYPRMEVVNVESLTISIPAARLAEMISIVSHSMADGDADRPILNGALIELNPSGLWVIATDGFRLSVGHEPITGVENQKPRAVVLPRKTVLLARKMLSQGDVVRLTINDKTVQFAFTDGTVLLGKAIDGKYPDWRAILPELKESIHVDATPLANALSMLSVTNDPTAKAGSVPTVALKTTGGAIHLQRGENGYCEVESTCTEKLLEADFCLNYLADAVSAISTASEAIQIAHKGNDSAIRLSAKEKEYPFILVMPRRS